MSLQDLEPQEQATATSEDYTFFDGDISAFSEDFARPKQDMNIDETPVDMPVDGIDDEEKTDGGDGEEPEEEKISGNAARRTAKFITRFADGIFAQGLAMLDGTNNPDPYRRTSDPMMHELENAVAWYCRDVNGMLPPWLMIIICIAMMYGAEVPRALKIRKETAERAQFEAKIKDLEKERDAFRRIMNEWENRRNGKPAEPAEPKNEEPTEPNRDERENG